MIRGQQRLQQLSDESLANPRRRSLCKFKSSSELFQSSSVSTTGAASSAAVILPRWVLVFALELRSWRKK